MFAYWTVNLLPPPCFLRCSRSSHAWNLFDLAERLWEDDRLLQPPLSGFRIYCGRKPIWVQIGRAESKTCFRQHSFMRVHLILWRHISMRRRAGNGGCCMATTVPSDTGLRPSSTPWTIPRRRLQSRDSWETPPQHRHGLRRLRQWALRLHPVASSPVRLPTASWPPNPAATARRTTRSVCGRNLASTSAALAEAIPTARRWPCTDSLSLCLSIMFCRGWWTLHPFSGQLGDFPWKSSASLHPGLGVHEEDPGKEYD